MKVVPASLVCCILFVGLAAAPSGQVQDHDYVGAERCRACHAEEFAAWERSPHARAFTALAPKDQKDPRCLTCHTLVPGDVQPALEGVQCESCHGPGRHYSVDYVMRDADLARALSLQKVDGATCARCHTDAAPTMSTFSFEAKKVLIKHWKDEPK